MKAARWFSKLLSGAKVVLLLLVPVLVGTALTQESSRKVVARTVPAYPELARKMNLAGKVKLEVNVSAAGSVTRVKLVGGNPVFEASAVEAVKQWKFESAKDATMETIILEFAGK